MACVAAIDIGSNTAQDLPEIPIYDDFEAVKALKFEEPMPTNISSWAQTIDFNEIFDPQNCELVSPCKACSFRELQSWPEECGPTGYRLIKSCSQNSVT